MKGNLFIQKLQKILIPVIVLAFCLGLLLPAAEPVQAGEIEITLNPDNKTITYGQNAIFTAAASAVPTPTVQWQVSTDGGTEWASVSSSDDNLTLISPPVSYSNNKYRAVFSSGTDNQTTNSAVLTVNKAGTTIVLTSSPLAPKTGDSVTYTATLSVTSPGAGTPTGTVTFKEGTTTLGSGTVSSGVATFTKSNVSSGSHTVTAEYSGDTNFKTSTKSLTFMVTKSSSAEGFAWAWGNNDSSQLGNNTTTDADFPVLVKSSSNTKETLDGSVNMVSAGNLHSLAVLGKNLYSWGDNSQGQLGRDSSSSTQKYAQDVDLPGGSGDPRGISAGYQHSLLCDSNGNVYAWGDDSKNQLGNILNLDEDSPVKVSGEGGSGYLSNIIAVSAGWQHSLALKSDGTVWAWGDNTKNQLGNGTTTESATPFQVSGLTGIIAIAAGQYHNLALASNGLVYAWGYNNKGQLGDGTTTNRSTPVQVEDLTGITAIAAGDSHNLAIKSDGTVWSWGSNSSGQLGDSSSTTRNSPVQVRKGEQEESSTYLDDIAFIAAGSEHSLALDSVGNVWAWGNNEYGQLGNRSVNLNDEDYSRTPVRVDEFDEDSGDGAEFIAAGGNHCLAVYDTDIYISTTSLTDGEDGEDYSLTLKAKAGNYGNDDDEYSSSGEVECTWEEVEIEEYTLSDLGLKLNKNTGQIYADDKIDADDDDYYFTFRAISKEGESEDTSAIKSFVLTIDDGSDSGSSSGGGSSVWNTVSLTGFTTSSIKNDDDGYSYSSYLLTSNDGNLTLSIPNDTLMENSAGNRLSSLTCVVSAPQGTPTGSAIVKSYALGPDGAKFDNGLTLTFKYGSLNLPAGVTENSLYIAYYNKSTSSWERLNGTLNTGAKTISINIYHFSYYALLGTLSSTTTTTTSTTTTPTTTTSTTTKTTTPTGTSTTSTSTTSTGTTPTTTTQTTTPSDEENEPGSTNWPVIIIIILVVILAAFAVLIIIRRRRKTH